MYQMGNFGRIVAQNFISLYHRIYSKIFFSFNFCRMIGHNKYKKSLKLRFLKNPLLGQMGNFGPIVAWNYTSLYRRICAKDFFQALQHDREQ